MAGVTLKYPATGSVTLSVALPWPAHNQSIGNSSNQTVNRTPSGTDYEIDHGPPWYQIARTFESLTESETQAVFAFYEAIGNAAGEFLYCYVDATGATRSTVVQVLQPPTETRRMRNMHDVQIVFVQSNHPDNINDALTFGHPKGGGTSGNGVIDPGLYTYPSITSSLIATSAAGQPFNYTFTAIGTGPITLAVSGLPSGLTFSGSAISGTPPDAGTFFITLSATNAGGTNQQILILTVAGSSQSIPTIVSPSLVTAFAGSPFSVAMNCTGSTPITLTVAANSNGVSATGNTVSGVFGAAGTYSFVVTATNSFGSSPLTVTVNVLDALAAAAPVITSVLAWSSVATVPLSYAITATGAGTITFDATGLPTGLTVSAITGLITGTPGAAGTWTVTIKATNGWGTTTASLALTVTSSGVAPGITGSSVVSAIDNGYPFAYQPAVTGSRPMTFTANNLPPGCEINSTSGRISGNVPVGGSWASSVTVTNAFGSATGDYVISVSDPAAIGLTSSTSASGHVSTAFSYAISNTGTPFNDGVHPAVFQYAASGLPPGLNLSGEYAASGAATIWGVPTSAGTYTVTLTISGFGYPTSYVETFTITITISS